MSVCSMYGCDRPAVWQYVSIPDVLLCDRHGATSPLWQPMHRLPASPGIRLRRSVRLIGGARTRTPIGSSAVSVP